MGSSAVPDSTALAFRDFVEWILEIDLSPQQETEIRRILAEEWAEDDRETIALVEANIATFKAVRTNSNERFRAAWREHNQPAFVAALEKHVSSDLGTSLLAAYRAAHRDATGENAPAKLSLGEIAMGVLGLAGAVALSALANREQTKRELHEAVSRDSGKGITDSIGEVIEAGKREVDELRETDPLAAAMKDLENQQRNQELINSWMQTNANIGAVINANMSGDNVTWRWS